MVQARAFLAGIDSDLTRETYLYGLKRFVASQGGKLLPVTPDTFRRWVKAGSVNKATVRATLTALRSFYNHVAESRKGFRHPFDGFHLRIPVVRDAESIAVGAKVLSVEQIRLVISRMAAEEARQGSEVPGAFLFKFLAMTGMQISEALSLTFWDPANDGAPGYVNYIKADNQVSHQRLVNVTHAKSKYS